MPVPPATTSVATGSPALLTRRLSRATGRKRLSLLLWSWPDLVLWWPFAVRPS